MSVDTVKTHMRALFEKSALGDVPHNRKRAALVERALTLGIVSARDLRVPARSSPAESAPGERFHPAGRCAPAPKARP